MILSWWGVIICLLSALKSFWWWVGGWAEIIASALLLFLLRFESQIWDIDFKGVLWVLTLTRLDQEREQSPSLTICLSLYHIFTRRWNINVSLGRVNIWRQLKMTIHGPWISDTIMMLYTPWDPSFWCMTEKVYFLWLLGRKTWEDNKI